MLRIVGSLIVILTTFSGWSQAEEPSQCFGTTADGRLENGWKLPGKGPNFQSYSASGNLLGRTYVHSTVYEVVLNAYSAVADEAPDKKFVYGETRKKSVGEFAPHTTHRNGLSVDFMVPLTDENGRSVPMRTHSFNKWGYDLDFDSVSRLGRFTIDEDAMAEHIYQLHQAALSAGVDIWRVIFDPQLQPMLHSTKRWDYLTKNINFRSGGLGCDTMTITMSTLRCRVGQLPNPALHPALDPARLALPLQTVCVKCG